MNKTTSQKGSALVVISIIATLIILGLLGFVLWNNYANKTPNATDENHTATDSDTTEDSAPQSSAGFNSAFGKDVSFTYPTNWTLTREVDGPIPFTPNERYTAETFTITAPSKDISVKLKLMASGGLGGACSPDLNDATIASITTAPVPGFQLGTLTEFTTQSADGYRYYAGIMRSEKASVAKANDDSCGLYMADVIFLDEEQDIKIIDAKIQSKVFNDGDFFTDLSEVTNLQATTEYQQAKAILASFTVK